MSDMVSNNLFINQQKEIDKSDTNRPFDLQKTNSISSINDVNTIIHNTVMSNYGLERGDYLLGYVSLSQENHMKDLQKKEEENNNKTLIRNFSFKSNNDKTTNELSSSIKEDIITNDNSENKSNDDNNDLNVINTVDIIKKEDNNLVLNENKNIEDKNSDAKSNNKENEIKSISKNLKDQEIELNTYEKSSRENYSIEDESSTTGNKSKKKPDVYSAKKNIPYSNTSLLKNEDSKSIPLTKIFNTLLESKEINSLSQKQNNDSILKSPIHDDIIIIGAGPIGLWTAYKLKLKGFNGKIIIYEKYKSRLREYNVILPKEKDILSNNIVLQEIFKKKAIPINELEKELLLLINNFPNVEIKYIEIDCLDSLSKLHSKNSIFIHCDGVLSDTRKMLFNDNDVSNKYEIRKLYNVIQFSYSIQHIQAQKISLIKHYPFEKEYGDRIFLVDQYINKSTKNQNGKSDINTDINKDSSNIQNKITIRMFVREDLYNSVKEYDFRNSCDSRAFCLNSNIKNSSLFNVIETYIKFRGYHTGERLIPNSFCLTSFVLDCYKSPKCSTLRLDDQQHFLLGDSAMGFPFYRNLTNGFVCSNTLTSLIMNINDEKMFFKKNYINNIYKNESSEINSTAYIDYDKFMASYYQNEIIKAKAHTNAIGIRGIYAQVISKLPSFLNFNRFSKKMKKVMSTIVVDFYTD